MEPIRFCQRHSCPKLKHCVEALRLCKDCSEQWALLQLGRVRAPAIKGIVIIPCVNLQLSKVAFNKADCKYIPIARQLRTSFTNFVTESSVQGCMEHFQGYQAGKSNPFPSVCQGVCWWWEMSRRHVCIFRTHCKMITHPRRKIHMERLNRAK